MRRAWHRETQSAAAVSTDLLRALPGGGAAVLRSLVKAILVAIWVLACMVVPEHASAGCPVEPELTELSITIGAFVNDLTGEIDVDRYREAYSEEELYSDSGQWPTVFPGWRIERTWRPGEPMLEIPVLATETSFVVLNVAASGSCIGEFVQVSGPDFFVGDGTFNCVECHGRFPRRFADLNVLPPYIPAYGRALFHLYSMSGELMAEVALNLEIHDARVRVSFGPGPVIGSDERFLPYTMFGEGFNRYRTDGDVIGVSEIYSDPIVSECWAGPWSLKQLLDHEYRRLPLSPPAPSNSRIWHLNYICRSFTSCLPREVRMNLRGDIPPSLLSPEAREHNDDNAWLWGTPGRFFRLEFTPTEEEIGEWDMVIECLDNEGNFHERPWKVIVTEGPELPSQGCAGCAGTRGPLPLGGWLLVVVAIITSRRRP